MKVDALTLGAVAFAGFAAYQFLKKPAQAGTTGDAGAVYGMLSGQRQLVGGALTQNTDYLATWNQYSLWDKNAPMGTDGLWGVRLSR